VLGDTVSRIASNLAQEGVKQGARIIQIESTKKYVETVRSIRQVSISFYWTQFAVALGALAFLISVSCFCLLLPWSFEARMLSVGLFNLIVFLGAGVAFFSLQSEERWMRSTRARELIDRALRL